MVIFKNEKYNSKAVFQIKGHLHKMSGTRQRKRNTESRMELLL